MSSTDRSPDAGQPHPALAERRRRVARDRGRRRRYIFLAAAGVAACVLAGYWLATGPVLTINSVSVTGYRGPDGPQLDSALTAAAGQPGSLISPPVETMTAVAQRFPGVETIHVSRAWPLGLDVSVVPATAFAIVAAPGQTPVVITHRGLVLAPAPKRLVRPSIVLSDPIPAFGQPVPEWAMEAIGFLELVRPGTRVRIQDLTYANTELRGTMTNGPVLILGTLDRLPDKAVALNTLLSRVSPQVMSHATYIDLSVPDRPAVGTGSVPAPNTLPSSKG
jgi:cell division septal protein FtsQ